MLKRVGPWQLRSLSRRIHEPKAGLDEGVEMPSSPHVEAMASAEHSRSITTEQSSEHISWAGSREHESATYSGTVNNWKMPPGLRKNPTIPHTTTRYRKWREFPYADELATGFVNPEVDYVISWDRAEDGRNITLELTLEGQAGTIMYDPKVFMGKYKYHCHDIRAKTELWCPESASS